MSQQKTKFIENNAISDAKLAQIATSTFKGRTTAGTGNVETLTNTQATALLNTVVGDSGSGGTKGLVPAPAALDYKLNLNLKANGLFEQDYPIDRWIRNREDFISGLTGAVTYVSTSTGTGSSFTQAGNLTSNTAVGIVAGLTGTTTTGRGSGQQASLHLGGTYVVWQSLIYFPTLSTVTDEYLADFGMHDEGATSNAIQEGITFEYNRLTSTNWITRSANNSSVTSTTTSTAVVEDKWIWLRIVLDSANGNCYFYVDSTLVSTHSANLPTGNPTRSAVRIIKSAGTTNSSVHVDMVEYQIYCETVRNS